MNNQRKIAYEGMIAETVNFIGFDGELIGGYMARPLGKGSYPGVIVIHEVFGLVEQIKEIVRKFTAHGYIAMAPDLYYREGPGEPEKISAGVRQSGGLADSRVIGDLEGAANALISASTCSGKIGCIGYCSGGRQTLLFACNTKKLSAAVDCYGGRVITDEINEKQPKAVIDMIADLSCPLLGLFGAADSNPSPEHVARLEKELKKYGKDYKFHTYPADTGHGFFADFRPSYRQESAVDGWKRIFDFYSLHLQ